MTQSPSPIPKAQGVGLFLPVPRRSRFNYLKSLWTLGNPKGKEDLQIIKPGNGLHQGSVYGRGAGGRGRGRSPLGASVWVGHGVGTENRGRGREAARARWSRRKEAGVCPETHPGPPKADTGGSCPRGPFSPRGSLPCPWHPRTH